jgi:hypothetical protein
MNTEILRTRSNALASALASTRSIAAQLRDSLRAIDSAIAGVGALEVPSINRSIRVNGDASGIRNAIASLDAALENVAQIVRDARSSPCQDQRANGAAATM